MQFPEQQHPQLDPLELSDERFDSSLKTAKVNAQYDAGYNLYVFESTDNVDAETAVVTMSHPSVKLKKSDLFLLRRLAVFSDEVSGPGSARLLRHDYTLRPLYADAQKGRQFPTAHLVSEAGSDGQRQRSFYAAEVVVSRDGMEATEVHRHDASALANIGREFRALLPIEQKQKVVKKIPREALKYAQSISDDVDVMALLERQEASPDAAVATYLGSSALRGY